ncbi:hypothetical protein GALL_411220 [mine drainage metagenome]|uniref:Uncharacterized protein n=1 Tax=mine drainage metagenome TaxID=410659 RepID=A0A1J5Q0J0_9ZZZZ
MLVGQHVFGVTTLQQAPPDEGAQDAPTQGGLHLGHDSLIDFAGRVEDDARRGGLHIGNNVVCHLLKHAIDHAHMEVRMLVQAGAEAVDEGHGTNVQGRLVHIRRTGAAGLQGLRNSAQEDAQHHAQHCPVALHEVAQPLGHRQHPLAHRQAGEHMVAQVCRRLHHAPRRNFRVRSCIATFSLSTPANV